MQNKHLRDIWEGTTGVDKIFTRLYADHHAETEMFTNSEYLNEQYYNNRSGDKTISPLVSRTLTSAGKVDTNSVTRMVNVLWQLFGTKWTKLFNTLSFSYNPIENYDLTEERDESGVTVKEKTSHNTDSTVHTDNSAESSNFGFNSLVETPRDKTEADTETRATGDAEDNYDEMEHTETGKHKLTRHGNIGVTTSQQMIQSERDLWMWNFYETMFTDVDSVLTLRIYDLDD